MPSQRAVYSSTAASPRVLTSSKTASTMPLIVLLSSMDTCNRACKSAANVGLVVERRSGDAFKGLADSIFEGLNNGLQLRVLEFERRLIHH